MMYIKGKWSSPTISGQCPPPCSFFTLTTLSNNKAVLYGGGYRDSDGSGYNNDVYTVEMTKDTVVSIYIIILQSISLNLASLNLASLNLAVRM